MVDDERLVRGAIERRGGRPLASYRSLEIVEEEGMAGDTGAVGALTEGTGVSAMTVPKVIKDLIVDFVKTLAAVFVANNLVSVDNALDNPHLLATAILGAAISTGYRFILRWGS